LCLLSADCKLGGISYTRISRPADFKYQSLVLDTFNHLVRLLMVAFPVFALYLSCAFNLLSLFQIPPIRHTTILPQQPGPPSRLTWASFVLAYRYCGHYCPSYFPATFPAPSVPPNTTRGQATAVVVTQIGEFIISTLVTSEAPR